MIFTCPFCGSHEFENSLADNGVLMRYCKGPERYWCDFSWRAAEDWVYATTEKNEEYPRDEKFWEGFTFDKPITQQEQTRPITGQMRDNQGYAEIYGGEERGWVRIEEQKEPTTKPEFTEVQLQDRTYHFPTGEVVIWGVMSVNVSKNGTHRLNTRNGQKHIIPPGWIHMEFNAADWTF